MISLRLGSQQSALQDMKRAELYELKNSRKVNVTCELHVRKRPSGQDYKVVAIHPNRTVIFSSEYDYQVSVSVHSISVQIFKKNSLQDTTTLQKSRLQLAPDVWIAYNLNIKNLSVTANDTQTYELDLFYPKRNISASAWYSMTENIFDSDVAFKWTKDEKSVSENNDYDYRDEHEEPPQSTQHRHVRLALNWSNEPLNALGKANQSVLLTLRHPSFAKDVTFSGSYYRSLVEFLNTKLVVNYCDDPEHLLTVQGLIKDQAPTSGHQNYTIILFGQHEVSELNLDVLASIGARPNVYETANYGKYKRGYLPLQEGFLVGSVNLNTNEVNYHKTTPYKTVRLYLHSDGQYPTYTLNGTVEDSPDLNSTGQFYVNIDDKFVRLEVNMTPDGTQNLQLYGSIPDARSASFELWRYYEDIRIIDITYYMRMNHSRLVTSQLVWRPRMKAEIKVMSRLGNLFPYFQFAISFRRNSEEWRPTSTTHFRKISISG